MRLRAASSLSFLSAMACSWPLSSSSCFAGACLACSSRASAFFRVGLGALEIFASERIVHCQQDGILRDGLAFARLHFLNAIGQLLEHGVKLSHAAFDVDEAAADDHLAAEPPPVRAALGRLVRGLGIQHPARAGDADNKETQAEDPGIAKSAA